MAHFLHKEEHTDDQMIKLEVNLDDISSEWLGYLMDHLLDQGANDVYYTPIYMKKNRPAILLSVLCSLERAKDLQTIIFKETTTLGVRYYPLTVHRLERRFYKLETQWGEVAIKEGLHNGEVVQIAPEYEDCKRIAESHHLPLKNVYQLIWKNLDIE